MGYNQGYADGYAEKVSNATISYTYHTHTGNSSTKGGCYTVPVTCNGTIDSKFDSQTCTNAAYGNAWRGNCINTNYSNTGCSTHGCRLRSDGVADCNCPTHKECRSCGKNYGTSTQTRCTAIIGYSAGCGKTTDTIESTTILFN